MNKMGWIKVLSILLLPVMISAQDVWSETTFEDFVDGWFLDGGSNIYVSAKGRIQMITRWDLNGDGFLDIVLPGSQSHTEKENIYIYLNTGQDLDGRSRIEITGSGTREGVFADFNKDGWLDLAVANFKDSHYSRVNTWIYYGSTQGYNFDNRAELPAFQATSLAAGDFNNDSWIDLVIACQWQENSEKENNPTMSLVYWNSSTGFKKENKTTLSFNNRGAHAMAINDLDDDNTPDIIALAGKNTYLYLSSRKALQNQDNRKEMPIHGRAIASGQINGDGYQDLVIASQNEVQVLLGSETGYSSTPSAIFQVDTPVDVAVADFDRNGFEDIVVANMSTPGGATWTDSYIFYSDGVSLDNMRKVSLPTLGASGVTVTDLNSDQFPDLIICNQRVTNELTLMSYIYWNKNGVFQFGNHSQLETAGAFNSAIGDVNNDGHPDVAFFNDEGGFRDGPINSYVYWGNGTRNYSIERRLTIPTHQIFGCGHADLDDDGQVDLVFARANFISGVNHKQSGLTIYWGDTQDYKNPTYLTMTSGYGGVRVADINRDGYLDMLAGGACIDLDNPEKHGFPIYWGSAKGFQHQARTVFHYEKDRIRGPLLMDLNRDSWLDIAAQVVDGKVKFWWGNKDGFDESHTSELDLGRDDHLMYIKGADLNKDGWLDLLLPHRGPPEGTEITSYIYYGSSQGFSNENRAEIPCYVPYQNSIADLNQDGWLDIFLTSYGGEVSGNRPSLIYWGGAEGFLKSPRTELPTYGSSGSETADYDGDGWLDILVSNHRRALPYHIAEPHRHRTPSLLYWGSPDGFSSEDRLELEAVGPSGMNLRDIGNSYDRGLYEDYISSPYEIDSGFNPARIEWKADTPFKTQVKFQIRIADKVENLDKSDWYGESGIGSWYIKSGSNIRRAKGRFIQYKARLITSNGGPTPYLETVKIFFE